MDFFHTLRNAVDYPLRQLFRWRRRGLRFRNEPKDHLFDHLPPAQQLAAETIEARLRRTYHLAALREDSTRQNYRINLFYLELLERACDEAGVSLPDPVRAVDIGPSHWFYVQGLYALLRHYQSPADRAVDLTAYEADAWRVYRDLRSRLDHAVAHRRDLPARYLPEAFVPQPGGWDVVLLLFPFVFRRDHLRWGLPRRLFDPRRLLESAWASVAPGGALWIVNQGEAEHQAQRASLEALGIPVAAALAHESLLYHHDLVRHALVARRR